jgi:hypothetical protein
MISHPEKANYLGRKRCGYEPFLLMNGPRLTARLVPRPANFFNVQY